MARTDLLFYGGGETVSAFGTLSRKTATWEDVAETFSRSSDAALIERDGVLKTAESGVVRVEWLDTDSDGTRETPSVLLEGQRTNDITQSEDLTHADWTKTRSSVNADQASDPEGGTLLDEIVEDATASNTHYVWENITGMTADANYALSCWAIANTRTVIRLKVGEFGADTTNFTQAWFNLSTGAVGTTGAGGTGAFVRAYVEDWTDVASGLHRCVVVGSVGNGATSVLAGLYLADADNSTSYNGDGSSSLYAGFAQLEDASEFASSYIATTTAATTRNADSLYFPYPFPPQEMTVYCKFVEAGTILEGTDTKVLHLGSDALADTPRLTVFSRVAGYYEAQHHNGTSGIASNLNGETTPTLGDEVELRITLGSDGAVQIHQSINSAAEESGAATAANTLASAWDSQRVYLNDAGGAKPGFNNFLSLKVARGTKTLAEMRAL